MSYIPLFAALDFSPFLIQLAAVVVVLVTVWLLFAAVRSSRHITFGISAYDRHVNRTVHQTRYGNRKTPDGFSDTRPF